MSWRRLNVLLIYLSPESMYRKVMDYETEHGLNVEFDESVESIEPHEIGAMFGASAN